MSRAGRDHQRPAHALALRQRIAKLPSLSLLRRAGRSKTACFGFGLILFWCLVALFAPILAPYDPNAQHMWSVTDQTPSLSHWFGGDALHRDMLSRIIWGARPVLIIAPLSLLCSYIVGITLGMVAAYYGGWIDSVLTRVIDLMLSFPKIVLYVVLIASVGPSAMNIVIAVILVSSPGIARLVRGLTYDLKSSDYVAAARIRGETVFYILAFELLPNARGPLFVDFCTRMGYTVISIGVLGFLGLGLPPPHPDWGGMVRDGTTLLTILPHIALIPTFAISSLIMGFNLLADGLQETTEGGR
jgi:peptide/nickel transport system permease protein